MYWSTLQRSWPEYSLAEHFLRIGFKCTGACKFINRHYFEKIEYRPSKYILIYSKITSKPLLVAPEPDPKTWILRFDIYPHISCRRKLLSEQAAPKGTVVTALCICTAASLVALKPPRVVAVDVQFLLCGNEVISIGTVSNVLPWNLYHIVVDICPLPRSTSQPASVILRPGTYGHPRFSQTNQFSYFNHFIIFQSPSRFSVVLPREPLCCATEWCHNAQVCPSGAEAQSTGTRMLH